MRRMTKKTGNFIAVSLLLLICAGVKPAAAADIKGSGSIAYVSRYIWRGQDLLANNDAAIQPSLTFALPKNLSLNLWGSFGIGGANDKNELDELDFTMSYSGAISKDVGYTLGHTYYTFHTAGSDESQETYAGLSFPNAPLAPAVTIYGDWGSDVSKGYYLMVTGSHAIPLGWKLKTAAPSLVLGLCAGYSDGQWSLEPGISDVNAGLSMPVKAGKFKITPSLTYTFVPGKASVAAGESSPPKPNIQDEFWGGISFGFDF